MTTDEQRTYLLNTLRKAQVGSSRRIWAEAMLKQLENQSTPAGKPATPKRRPNS